MTVVEHRGLVRPSGSARRVLEVDRYRWVSATGALGGLAAAIVLVVRLAQHRPIPLIAFGIIVLIARVNGR